MSASNATPDRSTNVYFDVPDSCLTSRAWGIRRNGPDISLELGEGALSTNNVMVWPTGAITLKIRQKDLANIAQYTGFGPFLPVVDAASLATNLITAGILAVENVYAYASDLPGMPALGPFGTPIGSPYIVKRIPAGGSFNGAISSGVPGVRPSEQSPLDRVAESTAVCGENQGWFLSWTDSGHAVSYPSYTWVFYFGQFAVAFTGSGIAELYQLADGGFTDPVKTWRYARAGQISGTAHSMAIFPHMGPDGTTAYIAFSNCQVDQAEVNGTALITTDTSSTPGDAVYAFPQAGDASGPSGLGPGVVTQAAPFRVDVARDLGLKFQVSLLAFDTGGTLLDAPVHLPCLNPLAPVTLGIDASYGGPYTIEAQLYDGDSPALFDPNVSTSAEVTFQFAGDGFNSPILWGYSLNRAATSDIYAPGQFTGGNLRSVHLSGYSGDPTQENGTLTIDDPRGELTALLTRGQFSVLVTIEHVENGTVFETPVFSGYVNGPEAHRRSKPGRVYPSPYRHLYTLPLVGNWLRLSEAVNHGVQQTKYYQDPSVPQAADGPKIGWKATDAIYDLLLCCGLTDSQINLPDLPVRLYQSSSDKVDQYAVETAADYAELAQRIASSYLGLNLCYDTPSGQWILVQGTPEGAPPLYSFYTGSPQEAGITSKTVVPTAPGAYGPNATYITEFRATVVPPDFTAIHVSTGVAQANARSQKVLERWIYNYNAVQVPGAAPPDHSPNNPDYFGRLKEAEIIDPSLSGGTDAETQAAVDWTAKRVYDFACHAQRLAHFESPLVFVLDPNTGLYRLPRYMDPISINGTYWIVKTCVPHYDTDTKQMATWEVIQPIAGQAVPVGTAVDRLVRTAADRQASKASGNIHHSGSFGNLATPAHATSRFRDLPRSGSTPYPIQDPVTGQFYYQLGYSGLGNDPLQ